MRKCDSCGKIYQENKDVFCPHCGAVAQKQCTHGSSFDSNRYERGEIYKSNNTQYQNTTYNQGFEPHAQRETNPYNKHSNNGGYGDKVPQINLPDFTKMLSKAKNQKSKSIGFVVFVIIIIFNAITAILGTDEIMDDTNLWEDATVVYDESINELYTVIDEATIEMVDTDEYFKTFSLEIGGMGFDDYLPENIKSDIDSGAMAEKIISEDTLVEMLICDFNKKIVEEESYNNAIENCYYNSGNQVDGKCKYEFSYDFEYDQIVHIASGVNFYLSDGRSINAQLPFSAFSVSENGEITYYTSYAGSGTAWNTVFSECPNYQEFGRNVVIEFGE